MKKGVIISVIAILLLAVSITYFNLTFDEKVSIQNDGVRFGMSIGKIKSIKGKPYIIDKNICDTDVDCYKFKEEILGFKGECSYYFLKSTFGEKLNEVEISIPNLSKSNAKILFNKVKNNLEKYYSTFDDYYVNNNLAKLQLNLGTDDGATGISCTTEYNKKSFTITVNKQY